jgi:hypothetical protein
MVKVWALDRRAKREREGGKGEKEFDNSREKRGDEVEE